MPFPALDTLRTPRLTIRPLAAADLPDLLAVNGDPEVTRFLPYATWTSLDDAQAWRERMQALADAGTGRQFVVALNDAGTVVGTILLFRFEEGSARAEIGYALGRAHWRRGVMAEALRGFCDELFTHAGLRRLEAQVNPANEASNALLVKLGFVHEGCMRQRWVAKGRAYDVNCYGALADEWLAARTTRPLP